MNLSNDLVFVRESMFQSRLCKFQGLEEEEEQCRDVSRNEERRLFRIER